MPFKSALYLFIMSCLINLSGCQSSSIYGSGPITLSKSSERHFKMYLSKDTPQAFLVTQDGKSAFYTYCQMGHNCRNDSFDAVSRCEDRKGKKCYIFAEYGKIVWQGYQQPTSQHESGADFSIKSFGGSTIYSGIIQDPGSLKPFSLFIGNGEYCQGTYKLGTYLYIALDCDSDASKGELKKGKYKGKVQNFSWDKKNNLLLKATGTQATLEMTIFPYRGAVSKQNKQYIQREKTSEKPKLKEEKNLSSDNSNVDNKLESSQIKCGELGFNKGTEKFGDCVMKLMDR